MEKDGTEEPIYRAAMEMQTYGHGPRGGRRAGQMERESHGGVYTTMCNR